MDGPNVNWKVFRDFQAEIELESNVKLLNVGSCGLHVVHGAYQHGMSATGWELDAFLNSAYYLLKDTPARREDYSSATGSDIFPKKFAPHRWVENVPVLERLLEILPHLRKYMQAVHLKKYNDPGTKSFGTVKSECLDPLIEVKLNFALTIARQLQPFLKMYQADEPLLPFLVPDLLLVVKGLLERFLTSDCLSKIKRPADIQMEVINDSENQKQIDLGFVAERILRSSKKMNEREVINLRKAAKKCLITLVSKILDKSPLKYKTAQSMLCLDPKNMVQEKSICKAHMSKLVGSLVSAHRVHSSEADGILMEFNTFLEETTGLADFNRAEDRLDSFLHAKMAHLTQLWKAVRVLLLLSHGQASIERGFSFNKQLVVENQGEDSLIARRLTKDFLRSVGGVEKVVVTRSMLTYARNARQAYSRYLEEDREVKAQQVQRQKRKAETDQLESLQNKRKQMKKDIDALNDSSRTFALKCEQTGNLTFIAKSNSLRHSAELKLKELEQLKLTIEQLRDSLKQ